MFSPPIFGPQSKKPATAAPSRCGFFRSAWCREGLSRSQRLVGHHAASDIGAAAVVCRRTLEPNPHGSTPMQVGRDMDRPTVLPIASMEMGKSVVEALVPDQADIELGSERRRDLRSKNSCLLITARSVSTLKGFAIRKAGSGGAPVRNRSG